MKKSTKARIQFTLFSTLSVILIAFSLIATFEFSYGNAGPWAIISAGLVLVPAYIFADLACFMEKVIRNIRKEERKH